MSFFIVHKVIKSQIFNSHFSKYPKKYGVMLNFYRKLFYRIVTKVSREGRETVQTDDRETV